MEQSNKVVIFTDGACSGNPGPGGWGAVLILNEKQVVELGSGMRNTTNNQMELHSVIESLKYLDSKNLISSQVDFYIDSTYVIFGATQWIFGWKKNSWKNGEGKEVANRDLWERLDRQLRKLKTKPRWNYVRGHTGVVGNERCDQIAVGFSQGRRVDLYQGSIMGYDWSPFPLPPSEPPPKRSWDKPKKDESAYYISYVNGVLTHHKAWADCESRVKGRSGAKFKKVSNGEQEREVLKAWGVTTKSKESSED